MYPGLPVWGELPNGVAALLASVDESRRGGDRFLEKNAELISDARRSVRSFLQSDF